MNDTQQSRVEEAGKKLKPVVIAFFYWWYNQPGSNTAQGFDDYITTIEGRQAIEEFLAGYSTRGEDAVGWIRQSEKPVDPHSEIVCTIGTTKYMGYVGGDKTVWPLGLAEFKPFPSDKIEFYFLITTPPKLFNPSSSPSTREGAKEEKL